DGTQVLYTLGAFSTGDLALRDASGTPVPPLNSINSDAHFDGNADWATNFSPTCADKGASTAFNSFVQITLSCTDPDAGFGAEAPAPAPIGSDGLEIVDAPKHGNIGALLSGGKLIYTPAKDFSGTDTFTYNGNDGTSDSAPATITVQVAGAGGGGGGGLNDK